MTYVRAELARYNGVLCADSRRARQILGWQPTAPVEEIMTTMVESDLVKVACELKHGGRLITVGW